MKSSLFFLLSVTLCVGAFATVPLTGCGGGNGTTAPSPAAAPGSVNGTGKATLTILWTPRQEETSRLIPLATRSLRVTVRTGNGDVFGEAVIVRPAGTNESSLTFEDLPTETLRIVVTAHPQEDGTGTPQAQAEAFVTVELGENAPIRVRLQSTIARIEVVADKSQIKVGETANIAVSAKNDAGELVMITPDTQEWTVSEEATRSGTAQITGVLVGRARLEVRETESGKSGATEILVGRSGEYFLREIVAPENFEACRPTGLTNDGYVVGTCTPSHGSFWRSFAWESRTGEMIALPQTPDRFVFLASGVNESRQIVGDAMNGFGYLLENENKFTQLQQLPNANDTVLGINNRGDIFGTVSDYPRTKQIGLWKTDGSGKILSANYSLTHEPFAINDQGLIVGQANNVAFAWHTDERTPTRLAAPLAQQGYPLAYDVNDAGKIVGRYIPPQSGDQPMLRSLVTWESPGSVARPYADRTLIYKPVRMNNREEIIGEKAEYSKPVLWKNGVVKEISSLVPTDWNITEATCINDRGQIAGTAERNGKKTMFLLTPQGGNGDLKVGVR